MLLVVLEMEKEINVAKSLLRRESNFLKCTYLNKSSSFLNF